MKKTLLTKTYSKTKAIIATLITVFVIGTLLTIGTPLTTQTQIVPQASAQSNDTIGADGVSADDLEKLNPLQFGASEDITQDAVSAHADQLSTPGGIINRIIEFAFPLAGIILFLMIVWGGFEMMTGAASKKSLDQGKQRVTSAILGFIVLFSVYWIAQLVEMIFGISMFGN